MIISTFELLVKPQLPKDLPPGIPAKTKQQIDRLRRNTIQGYFLTIANLSSVNVNLTLTFTVQLPAGTSLKDLVALFDTTGSAMGDDLPVILEPVNGSTNKFTASARLMAQGTGLFLIQPNILKPDLLEDATFEVRGYVEVSLADLPVGMGEVAILITPEHRGTFYEDLNGTGSARRDQIAYALPVPNGGLFKF
ncbi:hypothetical protein [Leptolyngbya ohadii]|uniref:hypothetical protein n=1 Tax=Leptolyngbya ohadii TaxID=1962290 RepID=UPI000B5A0CC4|nr:hypothetical protein [Leptolyngbya ohadii]